MDKLYTIHLINRTQICVCEMKPDDCPRGIEKDFQEALATGMLVIEDGDGKLDMIPVANIMHIECVPLEDLPVRNTTNFGSQPASFRK